MASEDDWIGSKRKTARSPALLKKMRNTGGISGTCSKDLSASSMKKPYAFPRIPSESSLKSVGFFGMKTGGEFGCMMCLGEVSKE